VFLAAVIVNPEDTCNGSSAEPPPTTGDVRKNADFADNRREQGWLLKNSLFLKKAEMPSYIKVGTNRPMSVHSPNG
jgi:hypothetical protein